MSNTAPEPHAEVIDHANKARDTLSFLEAAPVETENLTAAAIAALAHAVLAVHDELAGFRRFGVPVENVNR